MEHTLLVQDLAGVLLAAGAGGWVFRRAGLSPVVGYLLAGALIGPHSPLGAVVGDPSRIELVSQVGLVFLMFGIGLKFNLEKLRRLGGSVAVGTLVAAFVIFSMSWPLGMALGWTPFQGVFLAAALVASSSAIVSKVLRDEGVQHERSSQMAMGVLIVEDVLVVVLLAALGSAVHWSGGAGTVFQTVWLLSGFVALAVVGGLLLVPRWLRRLKFVAGWELTHLIVLGVLFAAAVVSGRAGFTTALGAFLLGAIVAGTTEHRTIERDFRVVHDLFASLFFVSVGMGIDLVEAVGAWPLVLVMVSVALVGRTVAYGFGLALAGVRLQTALRTGLIVTPLGEFSFIVAQSGVEWGVVPASFPAAAVGAAALTSVFSPLMARHAGGLAERLAGALPGFVRRGAELHQQSLRQVQLRRGSRLWRILAPRVLQLGRDVLLVTAGLAFSGPLYRLLLRRVAPAGGEPEWFLAAFWGVLIFAIAPVVVALWRNCGAMAMVLGEALGRRHGVQAAVEWGVRMGALAVIVAWLVFALPLAPGGEWARPVALGVLGVYALVFWRRMILWHSRFEIALRDALAGSPGSGPLRLDEGSHGHWHLSVATFQLPVGSVCAGRTLAVLGIRARYGCMVAEIDRHGHSLVNPGAEERLFPGDTLLVVGDETQLRRVRMIFGAVSDEEAAANDFEETVLEAIMVPVGCPQCGSTLGTLDVGARFGVQIAGLGRGPARKMNPGADEEIRAGDELLALGTPVQIRRLAAWLEGPDLAAEG